MALTQQQIDTFWHDGFLPWQRILDDNELELLRQEYDREFELAQRSGQFRTLVGEPEAGGGTAVAPKRVLQILQLCERNIHFRKLIHDTRILDVASDLVGPNLQLFHDQALFKPAFEGGAVSWHQDNAYWKCRPATLISCWLTLDDVDRDNGAMQLIPGSHLKPIWHQPGSGSEVLMNVEDQVDVSQAVVVDLPAGACMFHHCLTLHYTQPNTTTRQRRAYAVHLMQPGTQRGWGEPRMACDYSHPILRMCI
ncbi:MAG: phytanoyl-CoA dioxygenase family protein [Phycisphaeraceae bacterium]|nr:phytanoyl-CoA dioxygenase family protein [Phycisphaeraceae bacterium]